MPNGIRKPRFGLLPVTSWRPCAGREEQIDQNKDAVLGGLREKIEAGWSLLLPVAAIIETGNHIAQVADGRQRRGVAGRFVEQVKMALNGEAPWAVSSRT